MRTAGEPDFDNGTQMTAIENSASIPNIRCWIACGSPQTPDGTRLKTDDKTTDDKN